MGTRLPYILLSVAIGIICTATLFHIFGMSSPKWVTYKTWREKYHRGHYGLFEECDDNNRLREFMCKDLDFDDINMKAQVAQLMCYLALVTGVTSGGAAIVLLFILYLSSHVSRRSLISSVTVSAVGSIASSVFIFTTVCIFKQRIYYDRIEENHELGAPIYLCGTAGVLYVAAFVVMMVAGKCIKTTPTDNGINVETRYTAIRMETPQPTDSSDIRSQNENL